MSNYLVADLATLEAVRTALDTANAMPVNARIFRAGQDVTGTAHDPQVHGVFCGTRFVARQPVRTRDGGVALYLQSDARVDPYLGRNGLPARSALVATVDLAP